VTSDSRPEGTPAPGRTAGEEPAGLPDRTRDESDVGWGDVPRGDADDDERFLRDRPPHWQ